MNVDLIDWSESIADGATHYKYVKGKVYTYKEVGLSGLYGKSLPAGAWERMRTPKGFSLDVYGFDKIPNKMTLENITKLPVEKTYQANSSLFKDLNDVIDKHGGEMSLAEAIGVIEMVKIGLINGGEE